MTNFDYYSEFKDYATKHLGVSAGALQISFQD